VPERTRPPVNSPCNSPPPHRPPRVKLISTLFAEGQDVRLAYTRDSYKSDCCAISCAISRERKRGMRRRIGASISLTRKRFLVKLARDPANYRHRPARSRSLPPPLRGKCRVLGSARRGAADIRAVIIYGPTRAPRCSPLARIPLGVI
jgi:hypothetical protein